MASACRQAARPSWLTEDGPSTPVQNSGFRLLSSGQQGILRKSSSSVKQLPRLLQSVAGTYRSQQQQCAAGQHGRQEPCGGSAGCAPRGDRGRADWRGVWRRRAALHGHQRRHLRGRLCALAGAPPCDEIHSKTACFEHAWSPLSKKVCCVLPYRWEPELQCSPVCQLPEVHACRGKAACASGCRTRW